MNSDALGELRSRLSMTEIEVKITNSTPTQQSTYSSNLSKSPVNITSIASNIQHQQNIPSPSPPLSSLSSASSAASPPTSASSTGLRIIKEASVVSELNHTSISKAQPNENSTNNKKSRKNKTPVACRSQQQKKVSASKPPSLNKDVSVLSAGGTNFILSTNRHKEHRMDMIADKSSSANVLSTGPSTVPVNPEVNGFPPPPAGTGIKSYSDFMRNLAAKYNNNE